MENLITARRGVDGLWLYLGTGLPRRTFLIHTENINGVPVVMLNKSVSVPGIVGDAVPLLRLTPPPTDDEWKAIKTAVVQVSADWKAEAKRIRTSASAYTDAVKAMRSQLESACPAKLRDSPTPQMDFPWDGTDDTET